MDCNITSPYDFTDSYRVDAIISLIQDRLTDMKLNGKVAIKHDTKKGHYIEFGIPELKLNPFDQAYIRKTYKSAGWSDITIMMGTPTTSTVYLYLPQ
jgi:hypothetical protein